MATEKKTIEVDPIRFGRRLGKLYDFWVSVAGIGERAKNPLVEDSLTLQKKADDAALSSTSALVFLVGADENDTPYMKSTSLQLWLYGYEMTDTLAIFTKNSVHFLASGRKAQFFQPVESTEWNGSVPPISVIPREKADKDKANFKTLIKVLEGAGNKFGFFEKDKFTSEFAVAWREALKSSGLNPTMVDISAAFSLLFSVKEPEEIEQLRKAALATTNAWSALRKRLVDIIDQEKKVKHSRLAEDIEGNIASVAVQGNMASSNIESCFTPIIQSGGSYSLKLSAESNDKFIHYGTILSSLGARYQSYCSHVSRTLMVHPNGDMERWYDQLLLAELAVIAALRPGTRLCDVYEAGLNAIRKNDNSPEEFLNKTSFGFLTGLEFRDGNFVISPKCQTRVEAGMVFVVHMGLHDLKNRAGTSEQTRTAAILISDTVLVKETGENEILTEKAKSRLRANVIRFRDEAETSTSRGDDNKENQNEEAGRGKRSVVLVDQTRNKTTNEDRRKERQRELAQAINQAARDRLAEQTGSRNDKTVKRSNVSYKSYEKFPSKEPEVNKLNIYVDRKHDTVILPIFGIPVPFHISMIKNCSQSVEGEFAYLRINFTHPGSQIGKDNIQFPNPLATYLKELTLRASDVKEPGELSAPSNNLSTALRLIKEMQKKFRSQEAEEREKEGAVKQDKLLIAPGKTNPRLKDLYVRPNILSKRIGGALEAHSNGFRYTSQRGDKIDVLYNNIKHAFFQPCDNEMIILLHFNLKNPVMWGKKKYQDVQFYTEVGEITTDLGKYHHMQDRDDLQNEQNEREMRKRLNIAFQSFCEKVVRQTNDAFDFDTPFRELGFTGVPHRSSCTLMPTSACLVNLTEWPPFVVTLDDVELVHFERVSFQLKNFDMVFVFKDYTRKTQMVGQVPMSSLDGVKDWLNSCDIRYTEGIQSLNWAKIMKTIVDDPDEFFKTGGWNFLNSESDDEEGDGDSDESSDAYVPSDAESGAGDEDDDEDEDEDESGVESEEEDDSDASVDSEESSGKDWSDLEEEARNADKARDRGEEMDHRPSKDNKRKAGGAPPGKSRHAPPPKRRK